MADKVRKNGKKQVAFLLSPELIDLVKAEAYRTNRWEAHVVEEILRHYLKGPGRSGVRPGQFTWQS